MPIAGAMSTVAFKAALRQLDEIDLELEFQRRAHVFKGVPWVMQGPIRTVSLLALESIENAENSNDVVIETRSYKLFYPVSRSLSFEPHGEKYVLRKELARRVQLFTAVSWKQLLIESRIHIPIVGRRRKNSNEQRAARADALIELGEVSSARQALEAAEIAPGNMDTFMKLTDPEKRPPALREADPIPDEVRNFQPAEPIILDFDRFVSNLRGARKGAAAGPSGATTDHLRVILVDDDLTQL